MSKQKDITSFFKRKEQENIVTHVDEHYDIPRPNSPLVDQAGPSKMQKIQSQDIDLSSIERDPGKRLPMWEYPIEKRDEIRRAYLMLKPFQPQLECYPYNDSEKHRRQFQSSWFTLFPGWLEYSPFKDDVFCLQCILFSEKPSQCTNTFTVTGFRNWKNGNDGKKCALLTHIGEGPCSPHKNSAKHCETLLNQAGHIRNVIHVQNEEQIRQNRLRIKTSIKIVRILTLQSCALRGHDESEDYENQGNFLEFRKAFAEDNEEVTKAIVDAPFNAKYTSPLIQKEIIHIIAHKVRNHIREEIRDSKFCIIVDEARDESKREQMALILRFVDKEGFIRERFFEIVHVKDTSAATLKSELCSVLDRHNLDVRNIRGQGYDGASNMRGQWKGLQALFMTECPYAYYLHCFAHRLQLALVGASKEVLRVNQFFSTLSFIVNTIGSSTKRLDELRVAKKDEIDNLLSIGELESGKGANQIGTIKRAGDTRWGSYHASICSLLDMFGATICVFDNIKVDKSCTLDQRGDADAASNSMISYEFVFISHLMKKVLGIANILCQALQQKSQDIVNALKLVSTTIILLKKFREDGWQSFLDEVDNFCRKHDILIPYMTAPYIARNGRARRQNDEGTTSRFYRVEIYIVTIDQQISELNDRFNDKVTGLLTFTSMLEPNDSFKSFDIDQICNLTETYYPMDFTAQERYNLRYQLEHFMCEVHIDQNLKKLSTISELCIYLMESEKSKIYNLFDRLIRLVLTLLVSTATTERAFSEMKIMKTRLRNRMEDEYLADSLIIYIERQISKSFSYESLIEDFSIFKKRRSIF